jgi:hypothetical protein
MQSVAAVYDRRFFYSSSVLPAATDRRYNETGALLITPEFDVQTSGS